MRRELIDQDFQVRDIGDVCPRHITIISGDPVASDDGRLGADDVSDATQLSRQRPDPEPDCQWQTNGARVDVKRVTPDDACLFQAFDPL